MCVCEAIAGSESYFVPLPTDRAEKIGSQDEMRNNLIVPVDLSFVSSQQKILKVVVGIDSSSSRVR